MLSNEIIRQNNFKKLFEFKHFCEIPDGNITSGITEEVRYVHMHPPSLL